MIWLRHRHFFSLAAAMVVATALIWPALRVVSTGHEVNIEPLWRAAGATLTLGRTLRRDSPVERAAPRSLPLRRLAMLPLVAGTCLILGACTDADKLSQLADDEYAASVIADALPQTICLGDDDIIPPGTDRHRFTVVMGRIQLAHHGYERATFWRAFDASAITACGHPESTSGIGEAMIVRSPAPETRPQAGKLVGARIDVPRAAAAFVDPDSACQRRITAPACRNAKSSPRGESFNRRYAA